MLERDKVPARPLFVIATAFGLSSSAQSFWLQRLGGEQALPHLALRVVTLNLVYWYVPALLAPTIMAIAQRYPLGRVRFRVQVFIHVLGALAYSLVHTSAML